MKRMTIQSLLMLACTVTLGASLCQAAESAPATPPPVKNESSALAACTGHQAGDTVTFTNKRGTKVKGVCREVKGQLKAVREKTVAASQPSAQPVVKPAH